MREVPTHLKVFLLLLLPLLTRTHPGNPSRRQNFDESQLCLLYNIWSTGESEEGNFEVKTMFPSPSLCTMDDAQ
jgi:hypothetical protein